MLSIQLYFLSMFILSLTPLTGAQTVMTVCRGETVILPCSSPFQFSGIVYIKWRKDGETVLCTTKKIKNKIDSHNCQSRFDVNVEPVGLIIHDVRTSDDGVYNCTITQVLPPPTKEQSIPFILKVLPGLTVKQMKSIDGCVDLLCSLEGLSPEQVNFTWTRASELLLHHNVWSSINSSLHLCKPNWTDGDTITCHASFSSNYIVNSQSITVMDTEKGSPHSFPAINVILFIIFIIVITLMWTVYFIHSCKRRRAKSESPPADPQNETVSRR